MATFNEILNVLAIAYSDVIEPIFCIIYVFILIKIVTAKSLNFRSEFYIFSIATGVAAISNTLVHWTIRMIDVRFQIFPQRGVFLNILNLLSHTFGMGMSIGKTLSVAARFTAICFMHSKHIWDGKAIPVCLFLMFGFPIVVNSYIPLFPAVFVQTSNGYGMYTGITEPAYIIVKAVANCHFLFFLFSTVPMCIASVVTLRSQRRESGLQTRDLPEKRLAIYAVVLTLSHTIKSVLQIIWFVALVMNMKKLQAFIVSKLLLPNTLSAFAEPVLLILTSPKLRNEVFWWRRHKGIISITTAVSILRKSSERMN